MKVAFTAPAATGVSHDVLAEAEMPAVPRQGDEVEIDENTYSVTKVGWVLQVKDMATDETSYDDNGNPIGKMIDVVVRLKWEGHE